MISMKPVLVLLTQHQRAKTCSEDLFQEPPHSERCRPFSDFTELLLCAFWFVFLSQEFQVLCLTANSLSLSDTTSNQGLKDLTLFVLANN